MKYGGAIGILGQPRLHAGGKVTDTSRSYTVDFHMLIKIAYSESQVLYDTSSNQNGDAKLHSPAGGCLAGQGCQD